MVKLTKEAYEQLTVEEKANYVGRTEAEKLSGRCYKTLQDLAENNKIDYYMTDEVGTMKKREWRFNIKKYMEGDSKHTVVYARIAKNGPEEDLKKQISDVKCEGIHIDITDIDDKDNMKRPGIQKLLKLSCDGKISELIIAHENILGVLYQLINECIEKQSKGKMVDRNITDWSKDKVYPPIVINITNNITNNIDNSTTNNTNNIIVPVIDAKTVNNNISVVPAKSKTIPVSDKKFKNLEEKLKKGSITLDDMKLYSEYFKQQQAALDPEDRLVSVDDDDF